MRAAVRAACLLLAASACSAADRKEFVSGEYHLRFSVPVSWDQLIDSAGRLGAGGLPPELEGFSL
jgi:hypothetical protein